MSDEETSDIFKDVKILWGLRQQGHMPTIEKMLGEKATWGEIAKAISWQPQAAAEWYGIEIQPELAALRAENARLQRGGFTRGNPMTKEQKDLLRSHAEADRRRTFGTPLLADAIEAALREVEEWEESLRICRYALGLDDQTYPGLDREYPMEKQHGEK